MTGFFFVSFRGAGEKIGAVSRTLICGWVVTGLVLFNDDSFVHSSTTIPFPFALLFFLFCWSAFAEVEGLDVR